MAVDILHPGHLNIIREGAKLGEVVVGLMTDEALISYKRVPFMDYKQRYEVISSVKGVSRVIPQTSTDYRPNLRKLKPAYFIHGTDWRTNVLQEPRQQAIETISEWGGILVEPAYTEGVSSTAILEKIRSRQRSLLARLWEYQAERSPFFAMVVLAALIVGVVFHFSHATWLTYLISVVIVVLYLIQIRTSDEKKDFEHDNRYYKNRPVQRGLVTLQELAAVNRVAIVSQLVLYATFWDLHIFALGLISQGYAYLTRKEFFVREWIRQHFFIYNFSHYIQLIILFFAITYIIQPVGISHTQLLIFLVLNIIVVELGRKTKPIKEDVAEDTYSYYFGYKGTAAALIVASLVNLWFIVYMVTQHANMRDWLVLPVAAVIGTAIFAIRYGGNPDKQNQKNMENAVLLTFVASMLGVILGA